jgi:hypothetical protein
MGDQQEVKKAATLVEEEEEESPLTQVKEEVVVLVREKQPLPVPDTEEHIDDDKLLTDQEFKEESNKFGDLSDYEKKALVDLKQCVREALDKRQFTSETPPAAEETKKEPEEAKPVPEPVVDEPEKPVVVKSEPIEAETAVEVVIEEKVDDDGVRTVEAIKETIVSAASVQIQDVADYDSALPLPLTEEEEEEESPLPLPVPEEVSIWGILLSDDRSDVILLKFLRARDFKVKEAFAMLKKTILWRKQFGIDGLIEQDLGCDSLEKFVYMHGVDKEGHPVCYNVYGEFQNKQLYQDTFSDEAKRQLFLRWRIQFLERSIRKLDFSPGAVSTIVQVNDLKNSPGPAKWELRQATKQALQLLQDNYPEFVAKQVFINVPWWYLAVNKMISPFLTQRTRSKFVFAGPSRSQETLLRYISAEQVAVKYGGLSKDGEFATTDAVTDIIVKPSAKHTLEFPATQACELTWEVRVVGWDVSYGAEFVPSAEDSYTVIIQKSRKVGSNEEAVVCNSFKIGEAGKVVLTIHNSTSKMKKLLYRFKTKST